MHRLRLYFLDSSPKNNTIRILFQIWLNLYLCIKYKDSMWPPDDVLVCKLTTCWLWELYATVVMPNSHHLPKSNPPARCFCIVATLTCRLCYSLRNQFSICFAVLTEWIVFIGVLQGNILLFFIKKNCALFAWATRILCSFFECRLFVYTFVYALIAPRLIFESALIQTSRGVRFRQGVWIRHTTCLIID